MIVIVGTGADRIRDARCTHCENSDGGVLVIPPELLGAGLTIDDFVQELRKSLVRPLGPGSVSHGG